MSGQALAPEGFPLTLKLSKGGVEILFQQAERRAAGTVQLRS